MELNSDVANMTLQIEDIQREANKKCEEISSLHESEFFDQIRFEEQPDGTDKLIHLANPFDELQKLHVELRKSSSMSCVKVEALEKIVSVMYGQLQSLLAKHEAQDHQATT